MQRTLSFVLQQSVGGHHHLFEPALIRSAFSEEGAIAGVLDHGLAQRAESLIEDLTGEPDLFDQRAVIARAPREVQQVFVHLYFGYLERFMHASGVTYH